jgi:glycine/D-amino acid oxidase-like deaminating enzyme
LKGNSVTSENKMLLLQLDPENQSVEECDRAAEQFEELDTYLNKSAPTELTGTHVAIVGGGLIGLMSGYFLMRAGASVSIFESRSFAASASGRNAGGIYAFGRAISEVALGRISMNLWEQLDRDGIVTHFDRPGHAIVAMSDYEYGLLEKSLEFYLRAGLPTALLDQQAVRKRLPGISPEARGALVGTTDGVGYPFSAVTALVKTLTKGGARLEKNTPVREIVSQDGRAIGVRLDSGTVAADHVLISAGPWTNSFSEDVGMDLKVHARRSQLLVTDRVDNMGHFPFVSGNRIYARQTHEGHILLGGGGAWEKLGYDVTNTDYALGFITQHMAELFPVLADVPVIRAFAGTVELTPDHLPLFGRVPTLNNVSVSSGYHGHGFGLSASMGRLAPELVHSIQQDCELAPTIAKLAADFNPTRFEEVAK